MARALGIGLGEWYTENGCAQIAVAINKVLPAWHAPIEGMGWHDVKVPGRDGPRSRLPLLIREAILVRPSVQ